MSCLEVFLGGIASGTGRRSSQLASHLAVTPRRICLPRLATNLPQDDHRLGSLSLPRHPIGHSGHDAVQEYQPVGHRLHPSPSPHRSSPTRRATGISPSWPSATPFGLALGPD